MKTVREIIIEFMEDFEPHNTLKDMVQKWLELNDEYNGLCSNECGCEVEDLMPCSEQGILDCVLGHKQHCKDCVSRCEHFGEPGVEWCIRNE